MFYLGSVILCSFMLLGNRAGKLMFLLAAVHIIYFYFVTQNTDWVSNILIGEDETLLDQDFLITGILALFFISAQCNNLESSKNIVIQRITESRNELAAKNIELRKLSLVASKTDNVVLITDSTGVIEWVNDGFTRLMGYSIEEVTGKNQIQLCYGPKSDKMELSAMNEKLRAKQTYNGEMIQYKKNGQPVWIQMNITPIIDEKGLVTKFIFIEGDISERKAAQEKMEAYLRDLEKTNAELDKFAYIAAHDLKAPLRAIGNLTGWIEEDAGETMTEDVKNNFNTIKGRVKRMEDLINGLLEYSKADRKKGTAESISTSEFFKEVVEFNGIPENCKVEIGGNMPVVLAEKIKMQQVISNLVGNAIKYNDKPEIKVKIDAEELPDFWKFSITDNGPGIEPQYHEKVFVIFQTLNPRDTVESTGVGLSIVKKIVEEAGGKVWIDSDKGKGATFFFTWPKNYTDADEQPLSGSGIVKSQQGSETSKA
jgi:PAS domain S-box-containing protein